MTHHAKYSFAHYVRHFTTWADFIDEAELPPVWTDGYGSMREYNAEWAGTNNQDEAIELARMGWPEGRDLMVETMATANVSIPTSWRSETLDHVGAYPMVPVALAGDPACMVNLGDQMIASKPVIRLRVDMHTPAITDADEIRAHGAAILSIVNNLETTGYSVELSVMCAGGANFSHCGYIHTYQYTAVFKRAGDKLDLDRATFALIHPSTLRRLFFRIIERQPELSFVNGMRGSAIEVDAEPGIIDLPGARSGATVASSLRLIGAYLVGSNIKSDWEEMASRVA